MSNNNTVINIGFSAPLTLLFIGLKLANIINWSWWWVLSPIWISFSIFLIFLILAVLILFLTAYLEYKK